MPRKARLRMDQIDCVYHVCGRVAGDQEGYYPLSDGEMQRYLLETIHFYCTRYQCEVIGYCVMGNHYHLIIKFERYRKLSEKELQAKAYAFYPNSKEMVDHWNELDWQRFEKRLFNLSELMKSIQRSFTVWYNKKHGKRGTFWADRFKSTILQGPKAILNCLLYVDLNPVRAGLVTHPEDYQASSCHLRLIGQDNWLMPLGEIIAKEGSRKEILKMYRVFLYQMGSIPSKVGNKMITAEVYRKMLKGNFKKAGVYLNKLKYFTDGLMIGTKSQVQTYLEKLKEIKYYRRRTNAKVNEDGEFSLK